jgi:hypothetical protein
MPKCAEGQRKIVGKHQKGWKMLKHSSHNFFFGTQLAPSQCAQHLMSQCRPVEVIFTISHHPKQVKNSTGLSSSHFSSGLKP